MSSCYNKINQDVQNCTHKHESCTRNIRNIQNATLNKMPIGIHVDTKTLINTYNDYVPAKMTHGYFSADGTYHKL